MFVKMAESQPSPGSSIDAGTGAPSPVEQDRQLINTAREKGTGPLMWAFTKLSGPGWLQSAITLGGGSLGGSLYLGVLAGFGLMWLQPLAMILGVIMLSAIGYVALSTGERPFDSINKHVSPVLGWGWALATLMANFVWCMPQFGLGTAALQQNLMPDALGQPAIVQAMDDSGLAEEATEDRSALEKDLKFRHNFICAAVLFIAAAIVVWFYDSGGWGIKLFERILKILVGLVVISFFGVVVKMTIDGLLDWPSIFSGFIPDLSLLTKPGPAFDGMLADTGTYSEFWTNHIVKEQQKVMLTAAATAVGINMTFLLPYSMLQRGWDRDFRGLAIFDLSTGLLIPFMLATGCVVIAASTQFHGEPAPGLVEMYTTPDSDIKPPGNLVGSFKGLLDKRLEKADKDKIEALKAKDVSEDQKKKNEAELEKLRASLPEADMKMAAALVRRDAKNLADSLSPLVGSTIAHYVFGFGVLAMAISTIIILMLINGFVVCEMLGVPPHGWPHRLGCYAAGLVGSLGPFFWGDAKAWLVVPTSMFGMVLLPIAYWTFFLMMNSKSLLGDNMPTGLARLRWNVAMLIAAGLATFGSIWSIKTSAYPLYGFLALGGFVFAAIVGRMMGGGAKNQTTENGTS